MQARLALSLSIFLAAALSACGGGGSSGNEPAPAAPLRAVTPPTIRRQRDGGGARLLQRRARALRFGLLAHQASLDIRGPGACRLLVQARMPATS